MSDHCQHLSFNLGGAKSGLVPIFKSCHVVVKQFGQKEHKHQVWALGSLRTHSQPRSTDLDKPICQPIATNMSQHLYQPILTNINHQRRINQRVSQCHMVSQYLLGFFSQLHQIKARSKRKFGVHFYRRENSCMGFWGGR